MSTRKLDIYPVTASATKEGDVLLQKKKGRIIARMDGETAVKLGLEITAEGEKALRQSGQVSEGSAGC